MKTQVLAANLVISTLFGSLALFAQPARNPAPLPHLQSLVPEAERTQVMVLGTFHFREIQDRFKPAMVESILRKLESFKPDVIAVEKLPGSYIHELELRPNATSIHEELLSDYADAQLELGHEAQKLLKLDMIQASKALSDQSGFRTDLTSPIKRTLYFLAAYELPSALLAWSLVPTGDPARSEIPSALILKLDARLAQINEVQTLAIPLARRLGLTEIAGVDEFENPEAMEPIMQSLMTSAKDSPLLAAAAKSQVYVEYEKRRGAAVEAGDLLPIFRHINSPDYMAADVSAQWGVFLRTHLRDGSDRGRLALWEGRNFKIAGRIRAISSRFPGKRILVIYGVAHKPFLDAYLGTCSDIQIVQPQLVIK